MSPMTMCATKDPPNPTLGLWDSNENEMSTGRSGRTCSACSDAGSTTGLVLELAGASADGRSVPPVAGSLGPGVSCIRASMASVSTILELSPRPPQGQKTGRVRCVQVSRLPGVLRPPSLDGSSRRIAASGPDANPGTLDFDRDAPPLPAFASGLLGFVADEILRA